MLFSGADRILLPGNCQLYYSLLAQSTNTNIKQKYLPLYLPNLSTQFKTSDSIILAGEKKKKKNEKEFKKNT